MHFTNESLTFALYLMGLLGVVIIALAICFAFVASSAFSKTEKEAARALSLMVERAGVLQILTVTTIVMSIFVLRIIDALDSDAAVSVLSGVAGYVLGGLGRAKAAPGSETPDSPRERRAAG